ncbi:MFS transporter [Lentzea cavernae]|uniref:Membrane protein n=1 Tax=Lentzea cavernae TaxID=2020703 RepID=A0ABQ3MH68_9PSEU|nr:MFS transporter [Lentzea cavernae]GHH43380.1 membrane protein [Lentzea cavernae]
MRTYRDLFGVREFTPFFVSSALQVAGTTVSGLALGTMVYSATNSPLLSALAMFGPSLAQLVGAATVLSASDRLRPRTALSGLGLVFALGTAAQAIPGMPVWAIFVVVLVLGMIAALGGGVRYGLLNEILHRDGYLLGRSVVSMSHGIVQIFGFALGGVLVNALSARGTLIAAAVLFVGAAASARFGLTDRPPRAQGRGSVRETWRDNARLWSSKPRRYVFLALWVPNGLIVGAEALYVPYSPQRAGFLFAVGAIGMLVGDTLVGRFLPPRWRARLAVPMCLVLALPYLVFAFTPPLAVVVVAIFIATIGYSAGLLLQERLMELTPDELSGHALGLQSSGMLAMQGAGAAVAGVVAELTSAATAIATVAAVSAVVTLALAPGLRYTARENQPA